MHIYELYSNITTTIGLYPLFLHNTVLNFKGVYSLNAKELKVHSSEWTCFTQKGWISRRVKFTLFEWIKFTQKEWLSRRVKSHPYHSIKSENFTLFREWSLKPLFLEWRLLCLLRFKLVQSRKSGLSDHSLKRVKNSLLKERNFHSWTWEWNFHSWKSEMGKISLLLEWNFTLVRVKLTLFWVKHFHSEKEWTFHSFAFRD